MFPSNRALLIAAAAFVAARAVAQTAPATQGSVTQAPGTAPAAATATTDAGVVAGATVYDTAGGVVGTVESADTAGAVVSTGTIKVHMPLASFAKGPKGPMISLTRAELESQASAKAAEAAAMAMTIGANVSGPQGASVGTISAIEGDLVTLDRTTTNVKVKLPRTAFGVGPNGPMIGLTPEQLDAAIAGQTATTPATGG